MSNARPSRNPSSLHDRDRGTAKPRSLLSKLKLTALPISSGPSIRPTPTLPPTAPIALANDSRHMIDRPAFDAGTTLETAGGDGSHLSGLPTLSHKYMRL